MKNYTSFLFLLLLFGLHQTALSQKTTQHKPTAVPPATSPKSGEKPSSNRTTVPSPITTPKGQQKPAEVPKADSPVSAQGSGKLIKPAAPAPLSGLERGLACLKNKDATAARQAFGSVIDSGTKPEKKACRKLQTVADRYEKIYFSGFSKVERLRLTGDYMAAINEMYGLKDKFLDINRLGMEEQLRATDRYLLQEHDKKTDQINQERIQTFTKRLKEARECIVKSPERSKDLVVSAQKLMNAQEVREYQISNINKEANYYSLLLQGDEAYGKGIYLEAMRLYQEAESKKNTPEINAKIALNKTKLYAQYIKYGDDDFDAGRYISAAKNYASAKMYADNPAELSAHKAPLFPKLVEEGKHQALLGQHKAALEAFDLALEMGYKEEVKRLREESYHFVEYDNMMSYAIKYYTDGNTHDAKIYIESARQHRQTDQDRELLSKIEAHDRLCGEATAWLKQGDITRAEYDVASAKDQVPNGNWAYNLDLKIRDYYANIKSAKELLSTDLAKAKGCIDAAGRICYTKEVQELRQKAGM